MDLSLGTAAFVTMASAGRIAVGAAACLMIAMAASSIASSIRRVVVDEEHDEHGQARGSGLLAAVVMCLAALVVLQLASDAVDVVTYRNNIAAGAGVLALVLL